MISFRRFASFANLKCCTGARQYKISVIVVLLLQILENFSLVLVFSVNMKSIIVLS